MKKLLLVSLIGILLFSGCIGSEEGPTGQILSEAPNLEYVELGGKCNFERDCTIAYCSDSMVRNCASNVLAVTKIKCTNEDSMFRMEKDYETCACINNICTLKQ